MSACGHSAEKISAVLDTASSLGIAEAARIHQVHITTVYAWRRRFGRMTPAAIERVRTLEMENNRLMNAVASLEQRLHQLRSQLSQRWVRTEKSQGFKSRVN
jgi:putative transposase